MKKLTNVLILIVLFVFGFSACSKKGADKMIGKWKADKVHEMQTTGINVDLFYEFTKDKLFYTVVVDGKEQEKIETTYVIKSDDGTKVILDVTHPATQQKAEFTLKFDGDKIEITEPGAKPKNLTKV